MAFACKLCIVKHGLRGSDKLPQTEEELWDHLESVHHCPVMRPGEDVRQAKERFLREHPEALTCEDCTKEFAPWTEKDLRDVRVIKP